MRIPLLTKCCEEQEQVHKGKHGAVRVCARGFRTSPSMSLIPSASSRHISASPAVGESLSPYHFWCPEKNLKHNLWPLLAQASRRPQLTVTYKIVLILPTSLWFSLIVSIIATCYKWTLADVVKAHKSQCKNVKCLRPQLCWRWSLQHRMVTKGPLLGPRSTSMCCLQKPQGNHYSSSGAWSASQMHTPAIFKDSFLWLSLSNICTIRIYMMVTEGNLEAVWFT